MKKGKGRRLIRSPILWTGLGVALLLIAGAGLLHQWRDYRRELNKSPAAAGVPVPPAARFSLSRFPSREIRDQGLDIFRLERSRQIPQTSRPTRSNEKGFAVVGVVRSGNWRVVVRLTPQGRLVVLRPGEEVIPGIQVGSVTSSRVILREAGGEEHRYRVFRLDGFDRKDGTQRSQP